MTKLPLAIDIAETVAEAVEFGEPIDIDSVSRRLSENHPEANATSSDIAEILSEQTEQESA